MHIVLHTLYAALTPAMLWLCTHTHVCVCLSFCVCVCNEKQPLFAYLFGTFAVTISNSFWVLQCVVSNSSAETFDKDVAGVGSGKCAARGCVGLWCFCGGAMLQLLSLELIIPGLAYVAASWFAN